MKRYLAKGHRLRGVKKDLAGGGNGEYKSPETGTHSGMLSYREICAARTKRGLDSDRIWEQSNMRVGGTGANLYLLLLHWVTQKPFDSLERGWGNCFKVIHVCKETTDRDSREGTNGHMGGFCILWRTFHAC